MFKKNIIPTVFIEPPLAGIIDREEIPIMKNMKKTSDNNNNTISTD